MARIKDPKAIEQESFRIIDEKLDKQGLSPAQLSIIRRVIHATGDFEYQEIIRFHPKALEAAKGAFSRGSDIVTDVNMVRVGINKERLKRVGCPVKCYISQSEIAKQAALSGLTRATLAIRKAAQEGNGAIVLIGNAPTALWETLELVKTGQWDPALIIGVPVGFVGAAEVKEKLLQSAIPYITCLGNKGGSSVAVAIVNALLIAYEEGCLT